MFVESKSAALVAAVFVDFPKNRCNFLHKNKLDIVRWFQFLTGWRPVRSFSPVSVATIALWKWAPVAVITRSDLFVIILFVKQEPAEVVDKLPREIVERLLWRPEDSPTRLENSILQYSSKMLHHVEVKYFLLVLLY